MDKIIIINEELLELRRVMEDKNAGEAQNQDESAGTLAPFPFPYWLWLPVIILAVVTWMTRLN